MKAPVSPKPFSSKYLALAFWLILLAAALWISELGRTALINWNGLPLVGQFWRAALQPALDAEFVRVIVQAALTTFAFAVCGTTVSLVVGLMGGIVCSRLWWQICWPGPMGLLLWRSIRGLLAIPRAIHELIWGLLLLNLLGLNALVGVLAIAIPFGAITAKVFSEILDETPTAPLEALIHSGVRPGVAFVYAHFPQALPNLISYSFYRFECSLRSAAVLGVIGAGGLGFQIRLSLSSLQYEQLWTGFYALMVMNGLVDGWSGWLRRVLGFVSRMDVTSTTLSHREAHIPSHWESPSPERSRRPLAFSQSMGTQPLEETLRPKRHWLVWVSLGAIALTVPLCFGYLDLEWGRFGRASGLMVELWADLLPGKVLPQLSFGLLPLAVQTVAMSAIAITLASIGGVLFSFPAAQNFALPGGLLDAMGEAPRWTVGRVVRVGGLVVVRLVLLWARAIPAPILALVILYGMFPGVWPGALALAIHNFGILGRLMAEVNENLPDGPLRGLRSLGASGGGVVLYGVLPMNLPRFLAYGLYRWEVCLRETVIVGLVGAGGLGRLMMEQLSSLDYSGLAATLTMFVGLTVVVDGVSGWMRGCVR
ncbi:MAG: ABC transporter permease subunit [Cyanobacteria bacterium J06560_6]